MGIMKNCRPLMDAVDYFVREKRTMACMTAACGTTEDVWLASGGETGNGAVTERTLFDLASLTKLFTALTALRMWERGQLDLQRPAAAYTPKFTNLGDTTVEELLTFQVSLQTDGRVDGAADRAAAERILFGEKVLPLTGTRFYSDMHAMTLGYVLRGAAGEGKSLWALMTEHVLMPAGITGRVFCHVPEERLADCVDYSGEHRIEGDRWICRTDPAPGIPHDPKARLLMAGTDEVCGHAGLFAEAGAMTDLCRAVLRGDILQPETLRFMAGNRTGRRLPDGTYTQYLGCQCYVKHPVLYYSEIPVYMSEQAVGLSGFTGNHVAIDPGTGRFSLLLGNRVHDRLSFLIPAAGKDRTDYGLAPDGTGVIRWTDGSMLPSSVDYVHLKDAHFHAAIMAQTGWAPLTDGH